MRNLTLSGDSFRVDQVIFAAILHKFFESMKFLVVSDKELCGDYFQMFKHGTEEAFGKTDIELYQENKTWIFNKKETSKYINNCYEDGITVGICNFNTTELTNACIRSIFKKSGTTIKNFIILDNSSKEKFALDEDLYRDNLVVLDNTKSQIINFERIIDFFGRDEAIS